MNTEEKEFSVVILIYNEEGNIISLNDEIVKSISNLSSNYEIIYINDGSRDKSLSELRSLNGVTIINMNRNYGQATALDAGFKHANGKYVISLDGDGQNDPKDILPLYKKLIDENLDVVAGWRKDRKDSGNIKILTKIGRFVRRLFIADHVHDTGCTLRVYRREVIKTLDIGGEMHRYILALIKWKGFSIGELIVSHRPRIHGKSKYNCSKAFRGLIDLIWIWFINKYSQRPRHLFGYLSFISFFFSVLTLGVTFYDKFFHGTSLSSNGWFFISAFLLISSMMLFSFGMIIDLLIRIQLNNSPYEKRYYIREIINK